MKPTNLQKGFSLIEILVAMTIFAVGMLGIAMHMGQSLRGSSHNSMHAGAMQTAAYLTEQLNLRVRSNTQGFQQLLQRYQTPQLLHPSSTNQQEHFALQVLSATDSSPQSINLLSNTDYSSWQPPFNIALEVRYSDPSISRRFPISYVITP